MGNFLFYCLYKAATKSILWKKLFFFLAGNIIIAASFMPYFLYQAVIAHNDFNRDSILGIEHITAMIIMVILATSAVFYRRKIKLGELVISDQKIFTLYVFLTPVMIFTLSFLISFIKPMVNFRYLMPVSFPFFLSFGAILISAVKRNQKTKYLCVFLVWAVSLCCYEGKAGIPGGGYASYRQARAFIAADAASHPDKKSAMLDNAPDHGRYYGYRDIPKYAPESGSDVLYVFNPMFSMNEAEQHEQMRLHNINEDAMLIIIPNDEVVIFKKYF
jgi:hypothetical protein